MKHEAFTQTDRTRAGRVERYARLARIWCGRSDLLWSILRIKGTPSYLGNGMRWFDLASRMVQPMCCASWSADEKVARIVDHFRLTRKLGGILRTTWKEPRLLMTLPALGPQYSIKIDEAYWMVGDGLTTLSVWHGVDRMFTVSFVLAQEGGRLCVYIGAIQGRSGEDVRALYKDMTKDAHGLRPRDLAIELHRMFCRALGATQIYGVSERSRSWNDRFAPQDRFVSASLNYDEAWDERGGCRVSADWFSLPVEPQRRSIEDIPSRKRALYRDRYAMLDAIDKNMAEAVRQLVPGAHPSRAAAYRLADAVKISESRILA